MIGEIEVFSTCPQAMDVDPKEYMDQISKVSRWSEDCNCRGILVYTDNRQLDPWVVSQEIIRNTHKLSPLVAVQPAYTHPYAVAKLVATTGYLYNRKLYLNMVAGGFKNDLESLNDKTPHDNRYDRLSEYTEIIKMLLENDQPVTFQGEYYKVRNLRLGYSLEEELFPEIFVSGSSEAGMQAARNLKATAIQYPEPAKDYAGKKLDESMSFGIRIGIIARSHAKQAWKAGLDRFPLDRAGQLAHKLALKTTDSVWYKKLATIADDKKRLSRAENGKMSNMDTYWLHPFKNYKTMCPYLVGSYSDVAEQLFQYIKIGYRKFILDIPPDREELIHIYRVFEIAQKELAV